MKTMKNSIVTAVAAVAISGLGLFGCERRTETSSTTQPSGSQAQQSSQTESGQPTASPSYSERVGSAAQNATEQVGAGAERVGSAAQQAGQRLAGSATQPATQPSGQGQQVGVSQGVKSDVQGVLGNIANNAVSQDGFDNLISYLSKTDRDRIGDAANQDVSDLNRQIAKFQQDWQSKYNQSLSFRDSGNLFANAQFTPGKTVGPGEAQTAGERRSPSGQQDQQGQQHQQGQQRQQGQQGQVTSADEKKNVTVVIPAEQNLPAVTLHLVNEGMVMNDWRVDVPDSVDAQTIKANLSQHLTQLDQQKQDWPDDPNQARQLVAHHILMAVANAQPSGQPGQFRGGSSSH